MKETSAGGVIYYQNKDEIEILMIKDRCNKWTFPKGKREEGETFQETALREIFEETGITGEVVKPLDKVYYEYYLQNNDKVEKDVYFYLVHTKSKRINIQTDEINSAKWFGLDEAVEKQKRYGYNNNIDVFKKAIKELKHKIILGGK